MTIKNLNDSISGGMISNCAVTDRRKMVVHKNIFGHGLFAASTKKNQKLATCNFRSQNGKLLIEDDD